MATQKPTIRRPALGRPFDERLTAEEISKNPALAGVPAFDPAQDVDLVTEMESGLGQLAAALDGEVERLEGQISSAADPRVDTLVTQVGDLDTLTTTQKGSLVAAINSNKLAVDRVTDTVRSSALLPMDFLPTDRPTATANTYQLAGPTLTAKNGSAAIDRIVVPLRPENVQADDVLVLFIKEDLGAPGAGRRIAEHRQPLTAGQAEASFSGPFIVPSGRTFGFMVGIAPGGSGKPSSSTANRFYSGPSASLSTPYNGTRFMVDTDTTSDVVYGNTTSTRIVLLYGASLAKTLYGPLDPYDLPTVSDTNALTRGSWALFLDKSSYNERYIVTNSSGSFLMSPRFTDSPTWGAPAGGNSGQVLKKQNGNDGRFTWGDPLANGTSNTASQRVVSTDVAYASATLTTNSSSRGAGILEAVDVADTISGMVRLRFYDTNAKASADWTRAYGTRPSGSNAPLLEYVFDAAQLRWHSPNRMFTCATPGQPSGGSIYWTADLLGQTRTDTTNAVTVTFRLIG